MSKVHEMKSALPQEADFEAEAEMSNEITSEDSQAGSTHARRIVVQANVSAEQLQMGHTVSIPGAADLFRPSYDMDKLNEEQKETMSKLDFSKGIVTGMTLKAVYSNVEEPVSVGVNLFQNKPQIVNTEGWLFTEADTDMGRTHTSARKCRAGRSTAARSWVQ